MSASKTPLTDNVSFFIHQEDGSELEVTAAQDCRAIELRLNAAVNALEILSRQPQGYGEMKVIMDAIANARKPL